MQQITTLSDEYKQNFKIELETGEKVTFEFEYRPNQLGWFFGFEYKNFKKSNIRLCTANNLLRGYRNVLPFGLAVTTTDGGEPYGVEDFLSEYCTLYLLEESDVVAVEANLYVKA